MSRRLSLAFLFALFVYGLSAAFAPPVLAVNCDLNACISYCEKRGANTGLGNYCARTCLQTSISARKQGNASSPWGPSDGLIALQICSTASAGWGSNRASTGPRYQIELRIE